MLEMPITAWETLSRTTCRSCGQETRLFGIETHSCVADLYVLSSVCTSCEAIDVDMVPLSKAQQASHQSSEGEAMTRPSAQGAFDPETTQLLATAFEKAWEALQASARSADGDSTASREALAKAIIAAGRQTPGDAEQLANVALAVVAPRNLDRR